MSRTQNTRGRRKPQLLKIDDAPAPIDDAQTAEVEEVTEDIVASEPEDEAPADEVEGVTEDIVPAKDTKPLAAPSIPMACVLELLDEHALRAVTAWAAACEELGSARNRVFVRHADGILENATMFNRTDEQPRMDLAAVHKSSGIGGTYSFEVYVALWERVAALYPVAGCRVDGSAAVLPARRVMGIADTINAYQRRTRTVDRNDQRELAARMALAYMS